MVMYEMNIDVYVGYEMTDILRIDNMFVLLIHFFLS